MRYKNINTLAKKSIHQEITFSNLISKRFYHDKKGWISFDLSEGYNIELLLDCIGGSRKIGYRRLIMDYIHYGSNYGIFERLVYKGNKWIYIAGQDYTAELNTIRKIFREGR